MPNRKKWIRYVLYAVEILLLMDHGHLAETGTAQELIHHPQTQEARDFLRNWKVE